MTLLRICWGIDALALLLAIYFFFDTLPSATSPDASFLGAWLFLLALPAGCLWGSYWLAQHGHTGWATLLAAIPALPTMLYGLFMLLVIFSGSRWN